MAAKLVHNSSRICLAQQKIFDQCLLRAEQAKIELETVRARRDEVERATAKAQQAEHFVRRSARSSSGLNARTGQLRAAFEQFELLKTRRGEIYPMSPPISRR